MFRTSQFQGEVKSLSGDRRKRPHGFSCTRTAAHAVIAVTYGGVLLDPPPVQISFNFLSIYVVLRSMYLE